MRHYFTHHYDSLTIINPELLWYEKTWLTIRSWLSIIFQRIVVMALLIFNVFPFKVKIHGKKTLDKALARGAVFLPVHSGPYPLLGRLLDRYYPGKKIAVTFYYAKKLSFFKIFRRFFRRMGVTVIALGGAMKEIQPILDAGGSMVLFLDAKLPINRTEKVKLFNKNMQLSTGPYYLAKRYDLMVVPIYVKRRGLTLDVRVLPAIPHKKTTKRRFMQTVAMSVEKMIVDTLPSWQIYDRFLLD